MSTVSTPKWSRDFDLSLPRGVAACAVLSVTLPLWEVIISQLTSLDLLVNSAEDAFVGIVIAVGKLPIVLVVATRIASLDVRRLLTTGRPRCEELAKWVPLGLLIGLPSCLKLMLDDYGLGGMTFLSVELFQIVQYVLVAPLQEEIQYRAILFAALRPRGRLIAYGLSSVWFMLSHSSSYTDLVLHGVLGLQMNAVVTLLVFAIAANYIYERTGKLWLCIAVHAATNGIQDVGVIIGATLLQ